MILVDTSIWVDHLRAANGELIDLLESGTVLTHPFVIGELALGNLRQRNLVLEALRGLPQATPATDPEVMIFIDQNRLFGSGIGYVDAHLLAAARLSAGTRLWTRDKQLRRLAERLKLSTES